MLDNLRSNLYNQFLVTIIYFPLSKYFVKGYMENFLLLAILFKMRERPKKFLFEEANSKSFHKYYLIST